MVCLSNFLTRRYIIHNSQLVKPIGYQWLVSATRVSISGLRDRRFPDRPTEGGSHVAEAHRIWTHTCDVCLDETESARVVMNSIYSVALLQYAVASAVGCQVSRLGFGCFSTFWRRSREACGGEHWCHCGTLRLHSSIVKSRPRDL
jgi:hypothetical protein